MELTADGAPCEGAFSARWSTSASWPASAKDGGWNEWRLSTRCGRSCRRAHRVLCPTSHLPLVRGLGESRHQDRLKETADFSVRSANERGRRTLNSLNSP